MTEVVFRPATLADLPALLVLSRDGGIEPDQLEASIEVTPAHIAAFEEIDRNPHHQLVIADYEGKVVGGMQISFIPGLSRNAQWRGMLENVHVRGDMRSKGIGSKLVGYGIAQCEAFGCTLVQLSSNKKRKDAHRFYQRLGFIPSHEGFKLTLS